MSMAGFTALRAPGSGFQFLAQVATVGMPARKEANDTSHIFGEACLQTHCFARRLENALI